MHQPQLFLTGATGLLGSHVLARAVAEGFAVRALVRGEAPAFLQRAGVTVVRGDLADGTALAAGLRGATYAVHCAARVGDWGDPADYERSNVESLAILTDAARAAGLERFVAVSSLGVYAPRDHFGTDESEPACLEGFDAYTRTKARAELVVRAAMARGLPAVIVRPGFLYGARDRHVLPALAAALRAGTFAFFGSGEQLLDNSGAHNVTDAIFLALRVPGAVGETFNITDEPLVTRRVFVGAVATALGLPIPRRSIPLVLARPLTRVIDRGARLLRLKEPPLLSAARLKFLASHLQYSIEKAKRVLGYRPGVAFDDGITEAVRWYLANHETGGAR